METEESRSKSSLPTLSPTGRQGFCLALTNSEPVSPQVYVIARSKATKQSSMLKEIASLRAQSQSYRDRTAAPEIFRRERIAALISVFLRLTVVLDDSRKHIPSFSPRRDPAFQPTLTCDVTKIRTALVHCMQDNNAIIWFNKD